jgi:hypothetical protein
MNEHFNPPFFLGQAIRIAILSLKKNLMMKKKLDFLLTII